LQGGWRNINHTVVQGQQQPRPYAARTGGIARKRRSPPPPFFFFLLLRPPRCDDWQFCGTGVRVLFLCVSVIPFFSASYPINPTHTDTQKTRENLSHWAQTR
jgi:hypothetical protein